MKSRKIFIEIVCFLFILLFVYAASSKLWEVNKFRIQLSQSPLLTSFAPYLVWVVPISELLICVALAVPKFRLIGLYSAFSIMVMFTAYIVAILKFSDFVPCSCGGVLEKLGWTEHLFFNIGFVCLALVATIFEIKRTEGEEFVVA